MGFYLSKSTIAKVTVTCEIRRCASSIISKRHTWDVYPFTSKVPNAVKDPSHFTGRRWLAVTDCPTPNL